MEEYYMNLKTLMEKLKPTLPNNTIHDARVIVMNPNLENKASTSHISFAPFSEEETFENCTKRLEVLISDQTHMIQDYQNTHLAKYIATYTTPKTITFCS